VTGKSAQAEKESEEIDEDDVDISEVSDEEGKAGTEDWDKALPQFSTRPRTQRHRALGDVSAANHSTGSLLDEERLMATSLLLRPEVIDMNMTSQWR